MGRTQQLKSGNTEKEQTRSSPPDYGDLFYWAAHPRKKDMSDSVASFIAKEKRDTLADVFFLHPTTYTRDIRNANWNADLHDTAVNNATDMRTILNQASVFNNSCRVFAPRYRQAHIKAYLAPQSKASQEAFDLAYEDLKKAFEYYLQHWNNGRPIIIAAHSQGAMHAIRLLKEFFDGKPLQKQLVCAYIVGWQIKEDDFTNIKVGNEPGQTGCFVGWRSYKDGESDFIVERENGNSVCVNPITWTTTATKATNEEDKGAVAKNLSLVCPHCISASIDPEHKVLWVKLPASLEEQFNKIKNYHVADYNLFYLDIRQNVQLRVENFVDKNN